MISKERVTELAALDMIEDANLRSLKYGDSRYYSFLHRLCREIQWDNEYIVVFGVNYGTDLAYMAEATDVAIMAVDISKTQEAAAIAQTYDLDYLITSSLSERTKEELDAYEFSGSRVGVAFVDTLHTVDQVKAEIEILLPYMAERAIICVDDVSAQNGAVERYLKTLQGWEYLPLHHLHNTLGFGVLIR